MLSRSAAGGVPNGPSVGGAISGDRQYAALAAFTSFASNIVNGDTNGFADVFVVSRRNALADNLQGLPWRPAGPAQLVSRGRGGALANGPSYGADLDGDQLHDGPGGDGPHCVAFISAASNLVKGDTNGKPDAFVADLKTGRITRVSVDSRGRQVNGTTSDVEVDGSCGRVAFVSDAHELALTRTAWKQAGKPAAAAGLVTTAGRARAAPGLRAGAAVVDRAGRRRPARHHVHGVGGRRDRGQRQLVRRRARSARAARATAGRAARSPPATASPTRPSRPTSAPATRARGPTSTARRSRAPTRSGAASRPSTRRRRRLRRSCRRRRRASRATARRRTRRSARTAASSRSRRARPT